MAEAEDRKLERRLQQLIQEQGTNPSSLLAGTSKSAKAKSSKTKAAESNAPESRARHQSNPRATGFRGNLGLPLAIALSLLVGLQLGALPWRYRREMLQIQGGLVGLGIGFALGRLTARRPN
jgi:hypothetical protein